MDDLIIAARELAYSEIEKTGSPVRANVDLATENAKRLAKELGANIDIVEIGTLLMDCLLGQATKEGRLGDHVKMSLDKTNELLDAYSFSEEDKENIRHCVLEHHGVDKFYSLESEICCNADCYRFASVKGFGFALRYLREMPFEDLVKLLKAKADEKWNAISLDSVKKELAPERDLILKVLEGLK